MLELSIRPRVDETGGFRALADNDPAEIIHVAEGDVIEVGSLAHGMASGKPSVAFCFTLPERRVVIIETSLALFTAAARALAAAHESENGG